MVVEDNSGDLYRADLMLRKNGRVADILMATDGEVALAQLRKRHHNGEKMPSLILLDLGLPRMSGFEFLSALEEAYPPGTTRVVVLTGSSSEPDRSRSLSYRDVVDFVEKPILPRDIDNHLTPVPASEPPALLGDRLASVDAASKASSAS